MMLCCHYLNVRLSISLTRSFRHFMKHENKRWPLPLTGHDISKSRRCTCGRRYIWSTMQQCLQRTWGWGGGDGFRCTKLTRPAGKLMIMEMTVMFFIGSKSDHCLALSLSQSPFWILFKLLDLSKLYMDLSEWLHGFVKIETWISLSCYMDLSNW